MHVQGTLCPSEFVRALLGVPYVCLCVGLRTSGGIRSHCTTCTWTRIGPSLPIVCARCVLQVVSCSAMLHSRTGASDGCAAGAIRSAPHSAALHASRVRRQPSGLGRAGDLLREADGREHRADGGGHQEGPVPYARHTYRQIDICMSIQRDRSTCYAPTRASSGASVTLSRIIGSTAPRWDARRACVGTRRPRSDRGWAKGVLLVPRIRPVLASTTSTLRRGSLAKVGGPPTGTTAVPRARSVPSPLSHRLPRVGWT